MHNTVRIGLRRPDVIIDGSGKWLARGVEFEDRDDFARLRLLDQVVIVKTPIRRGVGTEAAAGVAGVATGARTDVEDADLQHVAGLRILHRDRAGQEGNTDTLAGSSDKRPLRRAGAAPDHRPLL